MPEKRVKRKCEQLENLVTAVIDIACDGDIIVDFCSGGVSLTISTTDKSVISNIP